MRPRLTLSATGIVVALCLWLAGTASAQTCAWGGTSTVAPPTATPLRAYGDFLHAPGRVAVDGSGRVYATDPRTGPVYVRDAYHGSSRF